MIEPLPADSRIESGPLQGSPVCSNGRARVANRVADVEADARSSSGDPSRHQRT